MKHDAKAAHLKTKRKLCAIKSAINPRWPRVPLAKAIERSLTDAMERDQDYEPKSDDSNLL